MYYILYWIQYAVLDCDRHSTDRQIFFTHLGMMLMHGVTRCTTIYNYLHHCAVASINFEWHFPVHRCCRNLPVRMDCYWRASWEFLLGLHWCEASHGQSQRPQFLQLGFQIQSGIGWFPGSSDRGSNKFLDWLEPSFTCLYRILQHSAICVFGRQLYWRCFSCCYWLASVWA